MRAHFPFRPAGLLLLLATAVACGNRITPDPNNREIPWSYGPTTGGAAAEHVQGIGNQGSGGITKGWQCRLLDQKRLVITPYQLAESHALFGKVALQIGLFDKDGAPIGTQRSTAITKQNATFTFEIAPDVATRLWDVVFWYGEA